MADVVERYLTLGLRLGRHVDGLVDAYYGPPELAAAVEAEALAEPSALAEEADALVAGLGSAGLEPHRAAWLADQVRGLGTYARVLAGDALSYTDEVEACYGVRPQPWSEEAYAEAHARLDELLPSGGSLGERYDAWRTAAAVERARLVPALAALTEVLRARTAELLELPAGEQLVVEEVHDEPWWAFNYYLGGLRSRVVVNADMPTTAAELVMLAAHEAYPGHHTERVVKERLLVGERGWLEETILLVPTPQSVVCEGIAETGLETLRGPELDRELEATLASQGLTGDLALAFAVERARRPLRRVGLDAALIVHEHGGSLAEAQAHVERWSLSTPDRAAHTVRFATDPTWRAYPITYAAGAQLCSDYVDGDRARLRTLLTEQVRVADLAAARP